MKITETSRIHWACRRGMLELDQLLEAFFLQAYAGLSQQEQQDFVDLLASADQDLFRWLLGDIEPEHVPFQHLCEKIRQHYAAQHSA
jgi:antitoxin CptB